MLFRLLLNLVILKLNNNMRCFEMKVSMGSPDRELVKQ